MTTRSGPSEAIAPLAEKRSPEDSLKHQPIATVLLLTLIGSIVFLGYVSVIFNFFVGDDFVHLIWLSKAMHDPELIWRNFHSAWLDVSTARFYRPLISIFMVIDYSIAGPDGVVFHLDNLFFLIASSLLLFAIAKETRISAGFDRAMRTDVICPLAAGLFFGLYPLHPEAVSWITGRVDAIVTAFLLAGFWLYQKWRNQKKQDAESLSLPADGFVETSTISVSAQDANAPAAAANGQGTGSTTSVFAPYFHVLSLISFGLALLSKEMAVTLPPTLVAYELFVNYDWKRFPGIKEIIRMLRPTAFYWALLLAYLVVRTLALGTVVGGYDDSLFHIANWHNFIYGWIHALRMTFIPVNKTIISDHHVATICWVVCLVVMTLFVSAKAAFNASFRKVWGFGVAWFAISLLPVYKIFSISDDLQGSRFAYLATAPLCLFLAFAYASLPTEKALFRRFSFVLLAVATGVLFSILQINNSAWIEAGTTSNAIRAGLAGVYSDIKGDPQVLFVGLPDQSHGAYICRNALDGMTKRPQFSRDVNNCLMINSTERVIPFGFLKKSLLDNRHKVRIERWDMDDQDLDKVDLDYAFAEYGGLWRDFDAQELAKICSPGNAVTKITPVPQKTAGAPSGPVMKVSGQEGDVRTRPSVNLNSGHLTCFDIDFVEVVSSNQHGLIAPKHTGVDLFCTNDYSSDAHTVNLVHQDLLAGSDKQRLIFSLRSLPEWALGGNCRTMSLDFPEGSVNDIYSIRFLPAEALMPIIDFQNGGYMGTKGYMHIGKDRANAEVSYDTSKVPGAKGIIFEINRPNVFFDSQNTVQRSGSVFKEIAETGTSGVIPIKRADFPSLGLYEGRAWAVDEKGHRIGVAGDHIVFAVDS